MRFLKAVGFALAAVGAAVPATATVLVSVEAPGAAVSSISGYSLAMNNLDAVPNGVPTLTFTGSSITGTNSGFVNVYTANVYGGAGGTGSYGSIYGDTTITLSSAVNYFGLWGSALDGANTVSLYSGNTLLGSFALQAILESSAQFSSAYLGNPFMNHGDANEEFAFFNFASDTSFDKIKLTQNGGGGFEFDDLTIGTVSAAPEPSTWAMLLIGFGAIGWVARSKRRSRRISAV